MDPTSVSRQQRWIRRVTIRVPTWRIWLPLALMAALLVWAVGCRAHAFLSVSSPVNASVLVVEGWLPDYALREALDEFRRGQYAYVVASGGPMEKGALVSGYASYAAIAAETLRKLGAPTNQVLEAPSAKTLRHRTYQSAVQVRGLLERRGLLDRGVNVVSVGPHARRSWAVYRKVFGASGRVGVIEVVPQDYDAQRWWQSSDGVKSTITEGLGWLHELLFDSGRHRDGT